jgi:uncharacterized protein YcbK (DUF882 family)
MQNTSKPAIRYTARPHRDGKLEFIVAPKQLPMRQIINGGTIPDIPDRIEVDRKCTHSGITGIRLLALITLALLLSRTTAYAAGSPRQLDFYHTHTRESLTIVYHDGNDYVATALEELNHFLADFRTGAVHAIDPATLDILFRLRTELGAEDTFEIISGYRSPETNAMLRKQGRGVARRSQHLEGKAVDVRLRGVNTARLRDAAIKLQLGGVGYYRESDFVHIDSGRIRTW